MNWLKWVFIFFIVQLLYPLSIKAQDTLFYANPEQFVEVGAFVDCYADQTAAMNFDQIKALPDSVFKKTKAGIISFGNTKASIWAKLPIQNQTKDPLYIAFWGHSLAVVDVYILNDSGVWTLREGGTSRPFSNRNLHRTNANYKLGQNPRMVYINLKSSSPLAAQISVSSLETLANIAYKRDRFTNICLGILVAIGLYNLFLYFSVKERLYLYYCAYILASIAMTEEVLAGWSTPQGIRLPFQELVMITSVIFSLRFLNIRQDFPLFYKFFLGFIGVMLAAIVHNNVLHWQPWGNVFFQSSSAFFLLWLPIVGIIAYLRGNKSALYYTIAWTFLIVFTIISVLAINGLIPINYFTRNAVIVGMSLENLLLAFALAYRLKEYRDATEKAQSLALQRLEENETLIKQQNQLLEEKVTERTEDLQNTLTQLQNTESQLVQSEKMAALGELTAGIAHEINNPVNFISSSLPPLKRNLAAIEQLVTQYQSLTHANFEEKIKEIKAFESEMDYDYTKEEINLLTSSINDGTHRTAEIVKGLRNFSRIDGGKKTKTSVNEGLESTLLLMQSAVKLKNIELVKDLGNLPEINCFVGQLNQVFMNILTNAVQAMTEKGTITVKSFVDKPTNTVKISIADTGKGMTEEVKSKIFQPFFTTKDVGQGTGLGLSISYGIIKKHDGQIEVESTVGKGTTFTITLPIGIK